MPSSPMSFSINSRTSRPRSPISAITLISALVLRANIPISVLLPTPEPANIPIRWPFPTVISPSTAFTPSGSTSLIMTLAIGSGGIASTGYSLVKVRSATSVGLPRPSSVWPRISSPTKTDKGCPVFSTIHPTPMPSILSNGINKRHLSRNPTTSAMTYVLCSLSISILHKSFSFASGPSDSIVRPTTFATLPYRLKYVFSSNGRYLLYFAITIFPQFVTHPYRTRLLNP